MSEFTQLFAASQIIGARERQEDAYAALDLGGHGRERLLFVLADGMGGHSGAATVAQLAVRRFCEIAQAFDAPPAQRLSQALEGANNAIAKAAIWDETLDGAGCAFLSAGIDDGYLSWTSVGDCSLFLFRHGELSRLNADHSMRPVMTEMVATGRLSAKEAARDPRRHSLRSALKGTEIRLVDNSPKPMALISGDLLLLASDGIETLSQRTIAKVLGRATGLSPEQVVGRLLTAVRGARAPNQDNTTVIFYRFTDPDDIGRPPRQGLNVPPLFWVVLAAVILFSIAYRLYALN